MADHDPASTDAHATANGGGSSRRLLITVVSVTILVLFALTSLKSWRDLDERTLEKRRLTVEIAAAERRLEALETEVVRLAEDPLTLERLAREELGLVRADEVVIILPPEDEPVARPHP